jgi:lipid II:glycine glycyltransferase (peptidoglycan interpeptide bridge formation enzyme)
MIMKKQTVTDRESWNSFIFKHGKRSGAFLYAWEWSELARGERYEFVEDGEVVGLVSAARIFLPFGQSYLSVLGGPTALNAETTLKILETMADKKILFIRFEPTVEVRSPRIKKSLPVSPTTTLITSLKPEIKELLAAMHPKTRYNIGLAQRKNLEFKILEPKDLDLVWSLFEETAGRDGFRLHEKNHYQNLLKLNEKNLRVFLAAVFFEGRALAANIMVDFNKTRTYLHGASSSQDRGLMAPYFLHWELMKEAKKENLEFYDWWGIASTDSCKESWAGITRFKKGFGGETVRSPGTFDYVLKPSGYLIYKIIRCLKRFL